MVWRDDGSGGAPDGGGATTAEAMAKARALEAAVAAVQELDLGGLDPATELLVTRQLEVARRRFDSALDRTAGHLERSAAFGIDGHRNAKSALKGIGRLSGAEAFRRVQTSRMLRELPLVAAAYGRGDIPVEHVRVLVRAVSNPRVTEHVAGADADFAEAASTLSYDDFCQVVKRWSAYADHDGADQSAEATHERRKVALLEEYDGSWTLQGSFGALQGAGFKEIFDRFEQAEFEADWAEARTVHGPDARVEHLARTVQQRRADALFEMARRAATAPLDGRTPEPLVNIIVDQETFEDELRRAAGETVDVDPNDPGLEGRRCQTMGGSQLRPSEALGAALVGFVRRVVVDSAGTVIDLGRKRRLFTGSSREAVFLQGLLRGPGGLRCSWPACDGTGRCLQADHRKAAGAGGSTDVWNSEVHCGLHNRIKERGFRTVRGVNGEWTIYRPDGTPITAPA